MEGPLWCRLADENFGGSIRKICTIDFDAKQCDLARTHRNTLMGEGRGAGHQIYLVAEALNSRYIMNCWACSRMFCQFEPVRATALRSPEDLCGQRDRADEKSKCKRALLTLAACPFARTFSRKH